MALKIVGQVLQHTYRVERLIGEGGMGGVYEASHLRLARRFAIKLLIPSIATNPKALARFRREAEITSALGHPNIVEVIDFNYTEDGIPYFVMELLHGEDLKSRIRRQAPSIDQIAAILYQAASALAAAHEKGIIHRDLKPQNIFLCKRGNRDDFVKLVDFGISKVLGSDSDLTKTQTLLGTPYYMAPEQAEERASDVDPRTDVYAMGTILYEMLTGQPPFTGASVPALLYKITYQEPSPLSAARPDIPKRIEKVVLKALQKKSEDRWASMDLLWRAFAKAIGRRPTGVFGSLQDEDAKPAQARQGSPSKGAADTTPDPHAGPAPHFRAAQNASKQDLHSWRMPQSGTKDRKKRAPTAQLTPEKISELVEKSAERVHPLAAAKKPGADRETARTSIAQIAELIEKSAERDAPPAAQEKPKDDQSKRPPSMSLAVKPSTNPSSKKKATAKKPTAKKPTTTTEKATATKKATATAKKPTTTTKKATATAKKPTTTKKAPAKKATTKKPTTTTKKATATKKATTAKKATANETPQSSAPTGGRQEAASKTPAAAKPPSVKPQSVQSAPDVAAPTDTGPDPWDTLSTGKTPPPIESRSSGIFDVSKTPLQPERDPMASLWDTASPRTREREKDRKTPPSEPPADESPTPPVELDEPSMESGESTPDVFHVRRPTASSSDLFSTNSGRRKPEAERTNPFATLSGETAARREPPMGAGASRANTDEVSDKSSERQETAATHFDRGLVHLREGSIEAAMGEWKQALELAPNNRTYASNLRRLKRLRDSDEDDGGKSPW